MSEGSGRVFVIRPFGTKGNKSDGLIDFDLMHSELITPALIQLGFSGGTTGEFLQQGMIHEDMFREIVSSDLVIADISIHNANAFYELGIRHALRDKYTILLRADKYTDDHVFDLKPERYLRYSVDMPADSVDSLVATIKATLDSESTDSPVFRLLPGLNSVDPQAVTMVPQKFHEELKLSEAEDSPNSLLTLKSKVYKNPWEREGLRIIARAMSKKGFHEVAADAWEELRRFNKNDVEANQKLATHYQRLSRFAESEQAASRCLSVYGARDWDKAETYSLIGSNYKTQWRSEFRAKKNIVDRQKMALTSDSLEKSYCAYHSGFECHRNHFYSGLNAVSMLAIIISLAHEYTEEWNFLFNNQRQSENELFERKEHFVKLVAATELAITSSIKNYDDDWARISKADLLLLTSTEPKRVSMAYSRCKAEIVDFSADAVRNQLDLYHSLGVFKDNVEAALDVVS